MRKKTDFSIQAQKESLIPIRPGIPGKSIFWNTYSRRFIYVPSFSFIPTQDTKAKYYRFTVTSLVNKKDYVFESRHAHDPLTPVWKNIPVGHVFLKVEGIDKKGGKVKSLVGTKTFYRAAVFGGPYGKPERDYVESARLALKYQFNQKHYQHWLTGEPDPGYGYNCYPSKMWSAVVSGMIRYANICGNADEAKKAMLIARNAGRRLISISEPADAPLEYFPPTYVGEFALAGEFKGDVMLIYPASAGSAYLELYDVTGKTEFLDAAKRIADTYRKIQSPGGSWPLKMIYKTGEVITQNICLPMRQISFISQLISKYNLREYEDMNRKAIRWMFGNPMKTFNWEGQFEDVHPRKAYTNHSHFSACSFAQYLFEHVDENKEYSKLAEELIRFAEDQFVVWEKPMEDFARYTPCALEQYSYLKAIVSSATSMIETFLRAYEATGKPLYVEKARALANAVTINQDRKKGHYGTYWYTDGWRKDDNWDNCATGSAIVMLDFAEKLKKWNKA